MSRRTKKSLLNKQSTSSSSASGAKATAALNAVFDRFRDSSDAPDTIGQNGTIEYLEELGVGFDEPVALVIAQLLESPSMATFTREGFLKGWKSINVNSFDSMKAAIPTLRSSLADNDTFKRIYLFTFNYAREPPSKSLPLDSAMAYWKLLLEGRFDTLLPVWFEFLENMEKEKNKDLKDGDAAKRKGVVITKDTWGCLLDFVKFANEDPGLEKYDLEYGSWPTILDNFVKYFRSKHEMDLS
ncbi:DUF298-domain-containing protein [Ascodesmis nigricans]|uniref:Defective in cullin neddylation protein n=1 Tax=Ascodesmis nigricans TaxID=341454 RepID=A0A4S2MVG8_9PEZI|nr:DUF298-domain-containing protein [Ascodesmis nigricans]